jgi:hypothetical protein
MIPEKAPDGGRRCRRLFCYTQGPPVAPPSSAIELQADSEQQRSVHRRQSWMEHLQVRREMTPGRDPQVVKELDPPLVPEPRRQALGKSARPEIVEPVERGVPEPRGERVLQKLLEIAVEGVELAEEDAGPLGDRSSALLGRVGESRADSPSPSVKFDGGLRNLERFAGHSRERGREPCLDRPRSRSTARWPGH